MSVYYASKAFVLSFSEALAQELLHTGVKVTAYCPGPTRTGFEDRAALSQSKLFATLKVADAGDVAEFGYRQISIGKTVAVHGWQNRLIIAGLRFMPRALVRRVMYRLQGRIK
ncbi:short chain dehydrogenase [compost metagenome]